jgi:hypothetical protein
VRARVRNALARTYRLTCRRPGSEELVEVRPGVTVRRFVYDWSRTGPAEARAFLDRLPDSVQLGGRSVMAFGRGAGDLGVEAAGRGARRVVAVDKVAERLQLTEAALQDEGSELPLELRPYTGSLAELGEQRFDVVLAVDAFRRANVDAPSWRVGALVDEIVAHMEEGGLLAIRWGPPWKSPYGGFIDSRLPWAHLIFPESLVYEEFRRARPGNEARGYKDRMTLAEFRDVMRHPGLERLHFRTNVGDRRAARVVRVASRIPWFEEYLTQNVYSVWRRSAGTAQVRA